MLPNLPRLRQLGCTFQEPLFDLATRIKARTVVETGVRTGVSTYCLLEALKETGGTLYSCDPMYRDQNHALVSISGAGLPITGRWNFIPKRSVEALPEVVSGVNTGTPASEWDIFVHDSDHNSECQIFELEFALAFVREGGFIVVNNWKGPPEKLAHHQVAAWAERHGLVGTEMGSAMAYEAPGHSGGPFSLNLVWNNAVQAGADAVIAFSKTKNGASERPRGYHLNKKPV
jgi:hypothetical protein